MTNRLLRLLLASLLVASIWGQKEVIAQTAQADNSGDSRTTIDQEGESASGDGVGGQVIGNVSSGDSSIDASNRSDDVSVKTGDSTAENKAGAITQSAVTNTGAAVTGNNTGDARGVIDQAAEAISGDGVGGQVIGNVTTAGGNSSIVADNESTDIDIDTGKAEEENCAAAITQAMVATGQPDIRGCLGILSAGASVVSPTAQSTTTTTCTTNCQNIQNISNSTTNFCTGNSCNSTNTTSNICTDGSCNSTNTTSNICTDGSCNSTNTTNVCTDGSCNTIPEEEEEEEEAQCTTSSCNSTNACTTTSCNSTNSCTTTSCNTTNTTSGNTTTSNECTTTSCNTTNTTSQSCSPGTTTSSIATTSVNVCDVIDIDDSFNDLIDVIDDSFNDFVDVCSVVNLLSNVACGSGETGGTQEVNVLNISDNCVGLGIGLLIGNGSSCSDGEGNQQNQIQVPVTVCATGLGVLVGNGSQCNQGETTSQQNQICAVQVAVLGSAGCGNSGGTTNPQLPLSTTPIPIPIPIPIPLVLPLTEAAPSTNTAAPATSSSDEQASSTEQSGDLSAALAELLSLEGGNIGPTSLTSSNLSTSDSAPSGPTADAASGDGATGQVLGLDAPDTSVSAGGSTLFAGLSNSTSILSP